MKTSSIYTQIAKKYNPKIVRVTFEDLKDTPGVAYKNPDTGDYYIAISKKIRCAFQVHFVAYHEIAHVALYHLGYRRYRGCMEAREEEADWWAFEKIGIVDDQGRVKPEWGNCHSCMKMRPGMCLKEMNGGTAADR